MNEEQIVEQNDMLERAGAFEQMVKSTGWKHLKVYFENQIQTFVTDILSDNKNKIEDYESSRQQLIGIKKLMGEVTSHLESLNRFREDEKANNGVTTK